MLYLKFPPYHLIILSSYHLIILSSYHRNIAQSILKESKYYFYVVKDSPVGYPKQSTPGLPGGE